MKFSFTRTRLFLTFTITLASAILLQSCGTSEGKQSKAEQKSNSAHESDLIASTLASDSDTAKPDEQLVVYYFHTNFRCKSCTTIEKYTREAVTTGFRDQLDNGRIALKIINVEEAGNEHFSDDYKLYTKSVILSDVKNGKEAKWKNLEKVWTLLGDEKKFIEYIQTEVKALL